MTKSKDWYKNVIQAIQTTIQMKMYSLHNVVFLTLLCVVSVQGDEVCSVLEHREMQADFTNCSRRYTEEHFNTENGDNCLLVKGVVAKCGELWERCHTSREVRRMRDLHIEAMVRQYGSDGGLDECVLVREYRSACFKRQIQNRFQPISLNLYFAFW